MKMKMKMFPSCVRETVFADELVTLESLQNQAVQKHTDEDFDDLRSGAFLPRIQLMTANSSKCKAGEFPVNNYALVVDQDHKDLGSKVDVLVCAWRPMALETGNSIVSVYDKDSDIFKSIQDRSSDKDSGCMWGFQFLLWVPAASQFATFFCGSKTARRAAPSIKALMKKAATLGSTKIDNGTYTWFGPTCGECSTPFDMPIAVEFSERMEAFNNPPEDNTELSEETSDRPQQVAVLGGAAN